jgi:hypothetical protein
MDEGLSGISAGASVDIKRTDGEYSGCCPYLEVCMQFVVPAILRRGRYCIATEIKK